MLKLLLPLAVVAALAGCSPKNAAMKLPPGATMEVYFVAAASGPNTTAATNPDTGKPLFLQTPPILTTADVATITSSTTEHATTRGKRLDVVFGVQLTPAGSTKLATATAAPAGKQLAVVINGHVIGTPNLHSQIQNGSFEISGGGTAVAYAVEALTKP